MPSSEITTELNSLHGFTVRLIIPKSVLWRIKLATFLFYVGAWVLGMDLEIEHG